MTDEMISFILILCITVSTHCSCNTLQEKTDAILTRASDYQFTTPELTDEDGKFLSYDVSYKSLASRKKRAARFQHHIYYKMTVLDEVYFLNLTSISHKIVSENYSLEIWDGFTMVEKRDYSLDCYFRGTVPGVKSQVVLSNCFGLQGTLSINDVEYLIEPMWNQTSDLAKGHSHVIYKRSAFQENSHHCKKNNSINSSNDFQIKNFGLDSPKKRRSVNFERYLETLIVADKSMVNYHGLREIEPYILSIMNIVYQLYRDASIGHSINIVVTRIILLIEDQPDLVITQHASQTLQNFCVWQKNINPVLSGLDAKDIAQHDNAILLTRQDICYNKDEPCDTLGLAHIAGICQPDKSCSINQDIGLVTAYTISHELGHNFGMQHDGTGNKCKRKSNDDKGFLMSKKLSFLSQPVRWSSCSRRYLTEFIDSGQTECMINVPYLHGFTSLPVIAENLEVNQQCRSQFGSYSAICWNKTNVCQKLWCRNRKGQCVTANIPVLNGTPCTSHKITTGWCFKGQCMETGSKPVKVDGRWSKWSKWNQCSRSCGGGVAMRERFCANPEPENGGKFCYGERKQYKSCNVSPCNGNSTSFRRLQCSEYDHQLFRGHFYQWIPYYEDHMNPCTLYCQAAGFNFFIKKAAKVIDGTKCFPNSMDVCVNGQCQPVGCDNKLHSKATEDQCGVCNGNGSTCITKNGMIQLNSSLNTFLDVLRIPKSAMHIFIKETETSKNILAMKSVNGSLSDQWLITLKPTYEIAGTVFSLISSSENESKSFYALGPTNQQIILTVLVKEVNKGIYYQFNIQENQREETKCEKCKTVMNDDCQDVNKVNYCLMALKLNFCNRNYFRKLCCKTCRKHVNNTKDI